jgi:Ca-activated chloride channel family protein
MRQAGFDRGDILLLTDHGDAAAKPQPRRPAKQACAFRCWARQRTGHGRAAVGGGISRVSLDPASLRSLASAAAGVTRPVASTTPTCARSAC